MESTASKSDNDEQTTRANGGPSNVASLLDLKDVFLIYCHLQRRMCHPNNVACFAFLADDSMVSPYFSTLLAAAGRLCRAADFKSILSSLLKCRFCSTGIVVLVTPLRAISGVIQNKACLLRTTSYEEIPRALQLSVCSSSALVPLDRAVNFPGSPGPLLPHPTLHRCEHDLF